VSRYRRSTMCRPNNTSCGMKQSMSSGVGKNKEDMCSSSRSQAYGAQTWNEGFEGCPDIVVQQCAVQTTLLAE
jgi:hypothetical protein